MRVPVRRHVIPGEDLLQGFSTNFDGEPGWWAIKGQKQVKDICLRVKLTPLPALSASMYFEVDKGPSKNGRLAGIGPLAAH